MSAAALSYPPNALHLGFSGVPWILNSLTPQRFKAYWVRAKAMDSNCYCIAFILYFILSTSNFNSLAHQGIY